MKRRIIFSLIFAFIAITIGVLACTQSEPASDVDAIEGEMAEDADLNEGALEDEATALPEEEGGGGIISGGVKPDDGNPHCNWLIPKAKDPKGTSLYGCRSSAAMAMKDLLEAKLLDAKDQPVMIIERRTRHRGYDIVFVVRTSSDQTLKLSK